MQPNRARAPTWAKVPLVLAIAVRVGALACSDIDRTRWKARFGDADAQIALGRCLRAGQRASRRARPRRRAWYRKAAEQKRTDAAGALARLYVAGEASRADPEQALHWFEVEAEAGGPDVQRALARAPRPGRRCGRGPARARSSGSSARPTRARSRRRSRSATPT